VIRDQKKNSVICMGTEGGDNDLLDSINKPLAKKVMLLCHHDSRTIVVGQYLMKSYDDCPNKLESHSV